MNQPVLAPPSAERLANVDSCSGLLALALEEIKRHGSKVEMVFGPVCPCFYGDRTENIQILRASITMLRKEGRPVFDQLPYEEKILELWDRWNEQNLGTLGQNFEPTWDEFYYPVLLSGLVGQVHLIRGWDTLFYAHEIRTYAHAARIRRNFVPVLWVEAALKAAFPEV